MKTYISPTAKHLALENEPILEISKFCDGAYNIKLPDEVHNCSVRLIHNNRFHDDWILLYLLIKQFIERQCKIELILPYISYGRQKPIFLQTLLQPLHHPLIQSITTLDLHQEQDGVVNKSTVSFVAKDILDRGLQSAILIAPDKGSIQRVERLGSLTGQQIIQLNKVRGDGTISISSATLLPQDLEAIIVDDMIDTGATLKACIQYLIAHGLKTIHVYATHGVLSYGIGDWSSQLTSLTFLNTLPALDLYPTVRWLNIREELI